MGQEGVRAGNQCDRSGKPLLPLIFLGHQCGRQSPPLNALNHRHNHSIADALQVLMVDSGDELLHPTLAGERIVYVLAMLTGGFVFGLIIGQVTHQEHFDCKQQRSRRGQSTAFFHSLHREAFYYCLPLPSDLGRHCEQQPTRKGETGSTGTIAWLSSRAEGSHDADAPHPGIL